MSESMVSFTSPIEVESASHVPADPECHGKDHAKVIDDRDSVAEVVSEWEFIEDYFDSGYKTYAQGESDQDYTVPS
ncbi:MAG: hypothetical protein Q9179_004467 [Wetmoreana sp. 5 TL-2023]